MRYFSLNKIKNTFAKKGLSFIVIGVVFWIILFTIITNWKYRIYAYNAIDLAYFNQIFWNMLNGRFFTQTIHPQLSLGDHAGLIMPALLPLYSLKADPRTLLFLQNIALAISAFPLFQIAKNRFGNFHSAFLRAVLPLGIALTWLLNPTVQNIALFEFHLLPFALFPLFMAFLEYDRDKKMRFIIYAMIALLVREDVALVLGALGIVAIIEKRSLWWRLMPLMLGAGWFAMTLRIIGHFNPNGSSKFLYYYAWLGESISDKITTLIIHPVFILSHLLTLANIEMILGFMMPLLLLPFLKPTRLILALGPFLIITLGIAGGGELILQTHYATLFLPAIFLAGIEGIRHIPAVAKRINKKYASSYVRMTLIILAVAVVYSMITIGPLPSVLRYAMHPERYFDRVATLNEIVKKIPPSTGVAASYSLLPRLSSREKLYSLHYAFLGVTQFAKNSYALPESTRYIAYDTDDLLKYKISFPMTGWTSEHYRDGFKRLRNIVGRPIFTLGTAHLYEYRRPYDLREEKINILKPTKTPSLIFARGRAHIERRIGNDEPILSIRGIWQAPQKPIGDLAIRLRLLDTSSQTIKTQVFPLANGLASTNELQGNATPETIRMLLTNIPKGFYRPTLELIRQKGFITVNGIRSTEAVITNEEVIYNVSFPPLEIIR